MAEMVDYTVYDDTATQAYTLEPISDSEWREVSVSKSLLAKSQASISKLLMKNKLTRRLFKSDLPVMEVVGTAGNSEGIIATPKVAHRITVSTAVFCDESRATQTEIAHAIKLHINGLMGDATAGLANTFRDSVAPPMRFLAAGVGGD